MQHRIPKMKGAGPIETDVPKVVKFAS